MSDGEQYKIRVMVDNAQAMPEDIHLALQAIAERVAEDQDGASEVEGFVTKGLKIGSSSGPIIMKQPENFCIGFADNSDGTESGGAGSCWINWW